MPSSLAALTFIQYSVGHYINMANLC